MVKQFSRNYFNLDDFHKQMPNSRIIHKINDIACYKYLEESKERGKSMIKRYYDLDE